MGYASLRECVDDLLRTEQLVVVEDSIDPNLEMAEVQRRVFAAKGPALFFSNPRGSSIPMVSNLFGSKARAEYIFRDALKAMASAMGLLRDPRPSMSHAREWVSAGGMLMSSLPRHTKGGPCLELKTDLAELPKIVSWPADGGPFVTLPQVFTENPESPGLLHSNLGMYRVQLAGNEYANDEVGLHYQIHRGIGVHHEAAIRMKSALKVNVFIGGPPAMTLAAIMPLPEGVPELAFAGALNRRAVRMTNVAETPLAVHADADVCIVGEIDPKRTKPEGPFGDHLGYYSLKHNFPVMRVLSVYRRHDAIWPFTVVGRPPQEDTIFGELIHDITGPMVPKTVPGVVAVHAVDAAGVHPLLFAIGSERYTPYTPNKRPAELLTQACAILGTGQLSLAKFLFIAAQQNDDSPIISDPVAFIGHILSRFDPRTDLHFLTNTTIDTLDYSGDDLNRGSKVIVAAVGPRRRSLGRSVTSIDLFPEFHSPRLCIPGVLAISGPKAEGKTSRQHDLDRLAACLERWHDRESFPLMVLVDDSDFVSRTVSNFLWVTFTRANPAVDIHGVRASVEDKAWGCDLPVIIDARIKPHHAPPLTEDSNVSVRVDHLFQRGNVLARWG